MRHVQIPRRPEPRGRRHHVHHRRPRFFGCPEHHRSLHHLFHRGTPLHRNPRRKWPRRVERRRLPYPRRPAHDRIPRRPRRETLHRQLPHLQFLLQRHPHRLHSHHVHVANPKRHDIH